MRRMVLAFAIVLALAIGVIWSSCSRDNPFVSNDPAVPVEGDEGAARFEWAIGPIEGITTGWHEVPRELTVPVGTTVPFKCGVSASVDVAWNLAPEVRSTASGSIASYRFDAPGRYEINAVVQSDRDGHGTGKDRPAESARVTHSCLVIAVPAAAQPVVIESLQPSVGPLLLTESSSNFETMRVFFNGYISPLRQIGLGAYRTSVGRPISLGVTLADPRFAALVETRISGQRPVLGAYEIRIDAPGPHTVSVGPPAMPRSFTLETFTVEITSHHNHVDHEAKNERVAFVAQTEPPGFEDEITWLSSTRSGQAEPTLGKGPTFEIALTNVRNVDPVTGARSSWFGVRADNTVFTADANCPTDTCAFLASWQNDKEAGAVPAGPNYVPFPGDTTSQDDINWLIAIDNSTDPFNILESVCYLAGCFGDFLWPWEKAAIMDKCRMEQGTLAQALCAGREVRKLFAADPSYVCRHHAIALQSVLDCLGIIADLECGFKGGEGHAWVDIEVGGNRYLLDSYNSIYICCLPGS